MRNPYPKAIPDQLMSELVADVYKELKYRHHGSVKCAHPTGFTELDQKIAGLHQGDLIMIAGRPAMGKSVFAANIISNLAFRTNHPSATAVFSLDMPAHRWVERILATEAGVDSAKLWLGRLQDEDWPNLAVATKLMADSDIHVCDTTPIMIEDICFKCRSLNRYPGGVGLIVIDRLQLIENSQNFRGCEHDFFAITRMLKSLAIELDVPIIILSELDRALEERADKRPQLSDLHIFGPIEQDADVIMFIYRDEVYYKIPEHEGTAEVIIAKQHNGDTGSVNLSYINRYLRFENNAV